MARYWVGGTGTWDASTTTNWASSSGGSSGASVPAATDDVFFDTNSGTGTCTINASVVCNSIQSSGSALHTLSHNSGFTVTIGSSTAGASSIALDFSGFTTYTLGSATTSAITFVSTSSTVQTVNFNSLTTGNVTYNATSNGSWKYTGAHNTGSGTTTTLTQGSLNFNGETCSMGFFMSNNSNTRTINLNSTSLTLTASNGYASILDGSNLTLNTTSCTVTLSGVNASFGPGFGYITWATNSTIAFTGGGGNEISDNCALGNFTYTGTVSKTNSIDMGASRTIGGNFTVNGNSVTNRVLITSYQAGTTTTLTCNGTNTFTNVDFMDITGAGTASWSLASITGSSGDCGGNSGITFTTAATQTWNGTSGGNWSTNAWTSRVPLPQDNVVISSAFSASQTVTADMPRLGASINWTGSTGSPTWSNSGNFQSMYGSLTMISGMTGLSSGGLNFCGRGSYTITNAGKTLPQLAFVCPNGTYTLNDSISATGPINSFQIGTFNANGFNITATAVTFSGSMNVTMGPGIWTLTSNSSGTIWNYSSGGTFSGGAATIIIQSSSASTRTFAGNGLTYGILTHITTGSTGTLVITGSNTFTTINFCDAANARTLQFTHGTTTTVTNFNVQGWPNNLITINSDSSGNAATLSKASGKIVSDYLSIQDSTASGGATWYAGSHSTSVSDNSGWSFTTGTLGGSLTATPVWAGLGVNYKADICFWNSDILYFKSIGLNNLRIHMPGSPQPWNSTTNAFWRYCAQYFHAQGFWVTWGTSQSPITNSNWTALHNSIVSEAQYLQQQNIVFDEYELGNEYEGAIAQPAASLTQTSGTATYTTSSAHGFSTGESVTVYNASVSGYNGTFTITVSSTTVFTYSVNSGIASSATSAYAYSLSITQLNANIRQLATDVKAVYSLGKVSYACWNNNVNGTYEYTDWITNGLGNLDTISIHPYSNINTSSQTITIGGFTYIQEMVQAFGSKCYVSECGLDASNTNLTGLNTGSSIAGMQNIYNNYLLYYLKPINSKAIFYMWSGYLNQDNQFAMQQTNGSLVPTWGVLLTNGNPVPRGENPSRTIAASHATSTQAKSSLFFAGNGTATEITPATRSVLQVGSSGGYTIGGRVKLFVKNVGTNNDNHTIAVGDFNYGSNLGYDFQVNSSNGSVNVYMGNTNYQSGGNLVQYGTWQSVIYRLNGSALDVFVQGVKVYSPTVTRVGNAGGSNSWFGSESTGTGSGQRRLFGEAREFFAVNTNLSDQQIQAIALNATYPTTSVFYKLDEDGGSTANDSSGNSNSGSISSPAWSGDTGTVVRTNLVTNPSFETSSNNGYWSTGASAGTVTGLTHNDQDTTYALYGSQAGRCEVGVSDVGQYYLTNSSSFTFTQGITYTFSAYVYVPSGSLIASIGIGIRDWSNFSYIITPSGTGGEVFTTVTPGQWTRVSYTATGGAAQTNGSASASWRFTIADPHDSNGGVSGLTSIQDYWIDGTMIEAISSPGSYFDGSNGGGSWTGTANSSTSILAIGRYTTSNRTPL